MFAWGVEAIGRFGAAGVFVMILLAPLPAELIMPMTGYVAGRGGIGFAEAAAAGTAASEFSALALYGLGRWVGLERLRRWVAANGRWLAVSPAELDRAQAWFARWGAVAVLVGRVVPGLHALVCAPAGVARMPLGAFVVASLLGSAVWIVSLEAAGLALSSQYALIHRWSEPVSWALLAGLAALYVSRVGRLRAARSPLTPSS